MISIADTGPGISTEDEKRIFNPLFTTKSGGMGMGLSICQSIVKAHGGELTVTSMKPYGTAFQLALPRGNGAREENARRV